MSIEFQVKKRGFSEFRLIERQDDPLGENEIRLKIDIFSFTANNITYAAAGDSLGYWQFFPSSDNESGEWGIIPVWSMADVVESNHADVPVGDRLYGYFPPATSLVIKPANVSDEALFDATAHRQALPPLYTRYSRVLSSPTYDRQADIARTLLGPLHMTSFALWDQLRKNDYYGSEQAIVVSASSKTSLGLAHGLSKDESNIKIVGLTSARNVEFVKDTGLYDEVIAYENATNDLKDVASIVVDMAGNPDVKRAIGARLGDNAKYYIKVGITHWADLGRGSGFEASSDETKEENFFAPSYILQRMNELGPKEFDKRASAFMRDTALASFDWMTVEPRAGLEQLAEVYSSICDGSLSPDIGIVVQM